MRCGVFFYLSTLILPIYFTCYIAINLLLYKNDSLERFLIWKLRLAKGFIFVYLLFSSCLRDQNFHGADTNYVLCHSRNGTAVRASGYPIFWSFRTVIFARNVHINVSLITALSLSIDEFKATGMRKVGPIAYLTQDSEFSFFYTSYVLLILCYFLSRIASTRVSLHLLRHWPSLFLFVSFESLMINLTSCGDRLPEFATRSGKLFICRDRFRGKRRPEEWREHAAWITARDMWMEAYELRCTRRDNRLN